ncbi:MAG: thiamine pyrophosphate-binding protein [Chloroflexota bacterium]|nr:thiamine pyrophosphate-binding protein [Chloroflexota bacterium]MDE2883558.1 thiamine pyrophosphate-binding protein [Chloroflexota bacterium]
MTADVHEHLSEMLARYGVTHLFGMRVYPLDRERVRQIVIHHEASAALMAYGYARVSGRVGVMSLNKAATPNAIMGLAEAWTSSVPVIVLQDGVPVALQGRNSQFEQDQVGMMRPVTKWIGEVPELSMAPEVLAKAFRISSTGRPRPVMVNLRGAGPMANPAASFDTEPRVEPQYGVFPAQRLGPDPTAIEEAAALLSNAERPCIVAGGGVVLSRAWDALLSVAEAGRIPVATTLSGKGSFPERHELSAGPTGGFGGMGGPLGRARIARKIVNDSDVVLLVGTRTNEMATNRWTVPDPAATIIHMDVDPEEPGRNYDTAVAIVSDARLGLEALAESLGTRAVSSPASREARVDEIRGLMDQWHADIKGFAESEDVPINAARVVHEVERFVDENTILVSDGSNSFVFGTNNILVDAGATFISPRGTGAIGTGLPMAIGAKLAAPDKRVICFEGDGGLLCGILSELETAARYNVAVTVVVFNNGGLNEPGLPAEDCVDFLPGLNFAAIARELGCEAFRVERPDEIAGALRGAVESGRPALVDVVCSRAKLSQPAG